MCLLVPLACSHQRRFGCHAVQPSHRLNSRLHSSHQRRKLGHRSSSSPCSLLRRGRQQQVVAVLGDSSGGGVVKDECARQRKPQLLLQVIAQLHRAWSGCVCGCWGGGGGAGQCHEYAGVRAPLREPATRPLTQRIQPSLHKWLVGVNSRPVD